MSDMGRAAAFCGGSHAFGTLAFRHRGREMRIHARQLLLHQGVAPQTNLGMSAGVAHVWNDLRLAFEPVLTTEFETSVEGYFVAIRFDHFWQPANPVVSRGSDRTSHSGYFRYLE